MSTGDIEINVLEFFRRVRAVGSQVTRAAAVTWSSRLVRKQAL